VWIKQLSVHNFRNFSHFSVDLSSEVTLIYGENGSGKTSLMEAIGLFGLGRSFRGSKIKGLTKIGEKKPFQVKLTVAWENEAIERSLWVEDLPSPHQLRFQMDGDLTPVMEMISRVPIQILYANSFHLLEGGLLSRRQLLDWGCFFLKSDFSRLWQSYTRVLKQRNALLRAAGTGIAAGYQHAGLWGAWDQAFLSAAEAVETSRQAYWALFSSTLLEILPQFLPGFSWKLAYTPGWPLEKGDLASALKARFQRDCMMGYTSVGPHRADIEILVGGLPARQVLSRGQTKLLICAMLTARAQVLYQQTGRSCVLLVDDVDAELDTGALERLFEALQALKTQWVATSVRPGGHWANKGVENLVFLPKPSKIPPIVV
jgi:DNA replication and repair protein RecF